MTTTTCPHDDDPNSCPPCRNSLEQMDNFLDHGPVRRKKVFSARYDGHCPVCKDGIFPDEQVAYNVNGVLLHESCH